MGDDRTADSGARAVEVDGGAVLARARAELAELERDAAATLAELSPDLARKVREARAKVDNLARAVAEQAKRPKRLGELLEPAFARFRARATGAECPVPVPWRSYAELVGGGLWPGVHVMGGGTGTGKTAFVMQLALHAARERVPVLYIGLELGELDATARAVGLLAEARAERVYPSKLMHGKWAKGGGVPADKLAALEAAAVVHLGDLPFYAEAGDAHGWDYGQLVPRVAALRELHNVPAGAPVLVVLDFLQLVDSPADKRREELRERITRASYQARQAVMHHNAAVVLVSSTSRENERDLRKWGEGWPAEPVTVTTGKSNTTREVGCSSFMGIGKESGDIEYSAETLTVLARVGAGPGSTSRIRVGVPKTRYGESGGQTTLLFNGGSRWDDDDEREAVRKALEAQAKPAEPPKPGGKRPPKGGRPGADRAAGDEGDEEVLT